MRITLVSTLMLLVFNFAYAASGITYHGRIIRASDSSPVISATTEFHIQIRSPGTESCLLWEEYQTKDLSASSGAFSVTIGDIDETNRVQVNVTNPNTGGNFSLPQVFSNRAAYASGLNCVDLSGTYTPGNLDGRAFKISFRENNAAPWEDLPLAYINYVPLAYNSTQLDGYRASEFLKIDPLAIYTPLTAGQVNTLVDIIAGTNTQYLRPATTFGGDVSGTYNAISVNRIRGTNVVVTAPTTGQVLKFDGTNWVPSADDTGAAPGDASYTGKGVVQIDTDLAVSGLTITGGVLSMPAVGTAGTYGSASSIPVITTDAKGRVTGVAATTVDDTSKLPLNGGTMLGAINMGTQNITNATSVAATNFSGRNFVFNDNDTNTATLRAPTDITTNYALTLPTGAPQNGYVLSTDAAGQLSWIAAASGSMTGISSTNLYLTVDSTTPATPTLTVNVGTAANTVAAGDDSRITGAMQLSDYNAQVAPAAACTTAQTSYYNTVSDLWACQNIALTLAGDVTGAHGTNTVARIRGVNVDPTAPTLNQVLKYDGTNWVASPDAGLTAETDPGVQAWAKQAPNAVFTTAGNELGLSTRVPVSAAAPIAGQDGQTLRWNNTSGLWEWFTPGVAGSGFTQGGNTFGANGVLGTNDNFGLEFETNGTTKMTILNSGRVGIGATTPLEHLHIASLNSSGPTILLEPTGTYGGALNFNSNFDGSNDRYVKSESAFAIYQDIGADALRFMRAPVGTAGNTLTWSDSFAITSTGNMGFGNINPTSLVDISGAVTQRGMAAPAVSPAGQGRIYFDSTSNKFRVSQNGGAYTDLVASGGVTGSGTTGRLPVFTSASGLGDSIIREVTGQIGIGGAPVGTNILSVVGGDASINGVQVGRGGGGVASNMAVGTSALASNTTGYGNTAVGVIALTSNLTGYENVGLGHSALASSTGNFNTAVGTYSLVDAAGAADNTAVGARSLQAVTSGGSNTAIGVRAGNNITTGNFNIMIGRDTLAPSATTDYQLNIGGLIYGDMTAASRMVDVNGSLNIRGLASAPSLSSADNGKIYYDNTDDRLKVSLNGGAYTNLLTSMSGFNANQAIVANGSGVATSFTCSVGQALGFDASGFATCTNITGSSGFVDNGNSFGGAATLGTNDNFALNFETNGTTKMTILNDGKVGIGTTTPQAPLDIRIPTSDTTTMPRLTISSHSSTYESADVVLLGDRSSASVSYGQAGAVGWRLASMSSHSGHGGRTNDFWLCNRSGGSAENCAMVIDFSTRNMVVGGDNDSVHLGSKFNVQGNMTVGTSWSSYSTQQAAPADSLIVEGRIGAGTAAPSTVLDINGATTQRGMAAPGLSPAGQGRIYFSTAENKFKVSQNGGAYVDLIGSGGVTGSGTTGRLPKFTSASALGDSIIREGTNQIGIGGAPVGTNMLSVVGGDANIYGITVGRGPGAESSNTVLGASALQSNTTGSGSTAIGNAALQYQTTGYSNVAVGAGALEGVTTQWENVAVGSVAGSSLSSSRNTAIGGLALPSASSGGGNTATGARALYATTTGAYNTSLGQSSGGSITTGSNNVVIGSDVGSTTLTTGSSNILIGSSAAIDTPLAATSNFLNIGNTIFATSTNTGTVAAPAGNVGIGVVAPATALDVSGAFSMRGMAAPATSVAGRGRIYYDSGTNKFRVSENNGAYTDLISTTSGDIRNGGNSFGAAATIGTNDNYALQFETNNSTRMTIRNDGNVGIGVAGSTSERLAVQGDLQAAYFATNPWNANSGTYDNTEFFTFMNHGAHSTATLNGVNSFMVVDLNFNAGTAQALNGTVELASAGTATITTATGSYNRVRMNSAGVATNAYGTNSTITNDHATGAITNAYGIYSDVLKPGAGAITNAYGVYVDALAGTNRWGIYQAGTSDPNFFGGSVGIGAGITAPATALDVNGAFSMRGMAAPATSVAGRGRIYYDSGTNKFRVSENNGAYTDLVSAGGGGVSFPTDSTAGASIAIGTGALASQTSSAAYNNIALGYNALGSGAITTAARNNIAIGRGVLDSITSGTGNIGIGSDDGYGKYPLTAVTNGEGNVAMGNGAGGGITTGDFNTAIGNWSMLNVTTTGGNTYVGASSGLYSTGENDTAVGLNALYDSQAGYNTALGMSALQYTYNGTNNVGVGYAAGQNITNGNQNVTLGSGAGYAITTGSNNVAIGYDVGATTLATGSNNILIGTSIAVDTPAAGTNNHLNIGNTIYANMSNDYVGFGTATLTHPLQVSSGAHVTAAGVWTNASDRRIKSNIVDSHYGLNELLQLRPVDYVMKKTGEKQVGFIAQEVQKVVPEVVSGFEGDPEKGEILGISYGNLIPVLVNAIKELFEKSEDQSRSIASKAEQVDLDALALENEELKTKLEKLENENQQIKLYLCAQNPSASFCK